MFELLLLFIGMICVLELTMFMTFVYIRLSRAEQLLALIVENLKPVSFELPIPLGRMAAERLPTMPTSPTGHYK